MQDHSRLRLFAGIFSLLFGALIMGLKFYAFHLSQSTAILSDALESVVNVAAAGFSLWAIRAAEEPPDEQHPYGHGKFEFVTAIFEGGLISFAALLIGYEALHSLWSSPEVPELSDGLLLLALAGLLNGALGFFLFQTGKRTQSAALEADGKHVFSDFISSLALIFGLLLVKATGFAWLDPLLALGVAIFLAVTGIPLVRRALDALIDAADPDLLEKLLVAMEETREPGLIRLHHVRAMRNGRRVHVDGHLVVPEFWSVEKAHDATEEYVNAIVAKLKLEGEMEFHTDPCRKAYCASCDLDSCPIRANPFEARSPLELKELVSMVDITDRHKP